MSTGSDMELLDRWRGGDAKAGNVLLDRHFAAVLRFFANKVVDSAPDLAQQVFEACVVARDRIDEGSGSFRAYLFGIARHTLFDHLRAQHRYNERFEPGSVSVEALTGSPSRAVGRKEEEQMLLAALRKIPVEQQIALELRYWEDLTMMEVAQALDVPAGTVRSRLTRARRNLERALAELDQADLGRGLTHENLAAWAKKLRTDLPG